MAIIKVMEWLGIVLVALGAGTILIIVLMTGYIMAGLLAEDRLGLAGGIATAINHAVLKEEPWADPSAEPSRHYRAGRCRLAGNRLHPSEDAGSTEPDRGRRQVCYVADPEPPYQCWFWWLRRDCLVVAVPKSIYDIAAYREKIHAAVHDPCKYIRDRIRNKRSDPSDYTDYYNHLRCEIPDPHNPFSVSLQINVYTPVEQDVRTTAVKDGKEIEDIRKVIVDRPRLIEARYFSSH